MNTPTNPFEHFAPASAPSPELKDYFTRKYHDDVTIVVRPGEDWTGREEEYVEQVARVNPHKVLP